MKTLPSVGDRVFLDCCSSCRPFPVVVVRINPATDPRFAPTIDVVGDIHGQRGVTKTTWLSSLSARRASR